MPGGRECRRRVRGGKLLPSQFPAGDYQGVDVVELLGLFYEQNFGAQLFEPAAVGVEIALQGQNSDLHVYMDFIRRLEDALRAVRTKTARRCSLEWESAGKTRLEVQQPDPIRRDR